MLKNCNSCRPVSIIFQYTKVFRQGRYFMKTKIDFSLEKRLRVCSHTRFGSSDFAKRCDFNQNPPIFSNCHHYRQRQYGMFSRQCKPPLRAKEKQQLHLPQFQKWRKLIFSNIDTRMEMASETLPLVPPMKKMAKEPSGSFSGDRISQKFKVGSLLENCVSS